MAKYCIRALFLSIFVLSLSSCEPPPELHISPGLHIWKEEFRPSDSFYTTVAPIVYGFKVPKWTLSDLIFPLVNCTTPEWSETTQCPTVYHMKDMQNQLSTPILNGQPLINLFQGMGAKPQENLEDLLNFECHKLSKHFKDFYISSEQMKRYLEKLQNCSPFPEMEYVPNLPNYDYNISNVYRSMREGYFHEVWLKVNDGRIDAGLWTNAQNILHSLNFLNYHVEQMRWHLAITDCQAGRIPVSLVSPDLMSDTLLDLISDVTKGNTTRGKNLIPIIGVDDVGNYFKSREMVDCTFTDENILYVRILVPFSDTEKWGWYSVLNVKPIKFWDPKGERICQIREETTKFILDEEELIGYHYPEETCGDGKLCNFKEEKNKRRISPCLTAILKSSDLLNSPNSSMDFEEIRKYCELDCWPASFNKQKVQVDFIKDSTYNVLIPESNGDHTFGIQKRTSPVNRDIFMLGIAKGYNIGAIQVQLPCNLSLLLDGEQIVKEILCGDEINPFNYTVGRRLVLKRLVPPHWVTQTKKNEKIVRDEDIYIPGPEIKDNPSPTSRKGGPALQDNQGLGGGTKFLLGLNLLLTLFLLGTLFLLIWRLKVTINLSLLDNLSPRQQPVAYRNMMDS